MPITLYNCKYFSFGGGCFEALTKASRGNHLYFGYVQFLENLTGNAWKQRGEVEGNENLESCFLMDMLGSS